jgi:aerobic-type carbon monoxide dehydrogenase small subunit (CoxS/CutS family)
MPISLIVNGSAYAVDVEPETPLLWVNQKRPMFGWPSSTV